MSNRERWIVYPLLFLALGVALRSGMILSDLAQDKVFNAGIIQCNALQVVDANNKPRVVIATDGKDGSGLVQTLSASGQQLAVLGTTPSGSILRLFDVRQQSELILANDGKQAILLAGKLESGGKFTPVVEAPFLPWPASIFFRHLLKAAASDNRQQSTEPADTSKQEEEQPAEAKPNSKDDPPQ